MKLSPLLEQLIDALRCLPGVGQKTAQRMAFQLLERNRDKGLHLANVLQNAMRNMQHCQQCRTFSETSICLLCTSPKRQDAQLCIVEHPIDMAVIEQMGHYHGRYFVLMGHLSPLDGIGPDDIGMVELQQRFQAGILEEVILATNPTVEGEATAHYIATMAKPYSIKVTRIAHGIPMGGELEYIDSGTLAHAFLGRSILASE